MIKNEGVLNMWIKRIEEGEERDLFGHKCLMLSTKETTEGMETGIVYLKKEEETPRHSHKDQEQAFIILKGKGLFYVGGEEKEVEPGMYAFAPRKVSHGVKALSDEFVYAYFAHYIDTELRDLREV